MRYLLSLIFIILMVFTGCQNKSQTNFVMPSDKNSTEKGIDTKQALVELEILSGEYRAQWEESYHYNTPILIESFSDWEEFLKVHPAYATNEDTLKQDFKEEFFNHGVVYAYIRSMRSGSIKLNVKGAELQGDKLRLIMQSITPEICTDDMAARICLFGIKKDNIQKVQEVDILIIEK